MSTSTVPPSGPARVIPLFGPRTRERRPADPLAYLAPSEHVAVFMVGDPRCEPLDRLSLADVNALVALVRANARESFGVVLRSRRVRAAQIDDIWAAMSERVPIIDHRIREHETQNGGRR
jgi:hypothetical protein